jgi:hypothetical protein
MRKLMSVACGAVLVLSGCGSSQKAGSPTSAVGTTTTTTTTSRPSRTGLPKAADGADVTACGDGTCEIEVSTAGPIPLPPAAGATMVLDAVGEDSVTLAFTPTDVNFSSGCDPIDACTNQLQAGVPGSVVRVAAGATVTFNKAVVVVVGVVGTSALLRISLA